MRDDYTEDDFDLLGYLVSGFSDIILVPNVLTEVSNLARQIGDPARTVIQETIRMLVESAPEVPIASLAAVRRDEFIDAGLTDAALLQLCGMTLGTESITLLTVDRPLAWRARALGSVLDYRDI